MHIAAVIVAAGKGERAGGGVPKQFVPLAGKPMIAHSVDRLLAHPNIASVHIVTGADQEATARSILGGRAIANFVSGGEFRQISVRSGIESANSHGATHVLIHDAARPFVSATVIDRLIAALDDCAGAVPVLPVVDTLAFGANGLGDSVDRSLLVRVQTPQAFEIDAILMAHQQWTGRPATDDAQMVRATGINVATVQGDPMLEKITLPEDFEAAERRLTSGLISRCGFGFDVHRLQAGRPLWLCGIQIPYEKGLAGHSDADVALHALVDALLGAVSEGDIGDHFPPSDPQWRGAASSGFVEHARDRVLAKSGIIDHVDMTITCEAPKIGIHRDAMRARIAQLLKIDVGKISVKATTTERLGFTGRGEGIAAQAVVTVRA